MKKTTLFLSALALSISGLMAQTTLEVGAGKTYSTLNDAWTAARTDPATDVIINVAEGTYVEAATLTATTGKKITFVGAGADKTIVKRSDMTNFTLPGTPGFVATKPNRLFQLNAGSDNLNLTFEKMSFQTIGYNDANGGGVINASGVNQQFTFRYCNFSNIMARAGGIIQVQGTDTLLVVTFDHCFVENCGMFDNNGANSLIYFRTGSCFVKNSTFMNNTFAALNIGNKGTGLDMNRQSGALIGGDAKARSLTVENCYMVNNKFYNGDKDKTHPMISMKSKIGADSVAINIKNVISVQNKRESSVDCDLYYGNLFVPMIDNAIFNAVRNYDRQALTETTDTLYDANVPSLEGTIIIDETMTYTSPMVNFEMDGSLPKILVGDYGVKYLNRIVSGVEDKQVSNLKIRNNNGLVNISSDKLENITIYNVLGARVADFHQVRDVEVPLTAGTYIVKTSSTNVKLLVK